MPIRSGALAGKHFGALREPSPPVKAAAMRNDARAGFRRSKNYASMQGLEGTPPG